MEIPRDMRFIPLKYAGRCRSCSVRLEVGDRAHWSPSKKAVWCVECAGRQKAPAQSAPPKNNPAGPSGSTARHKRANATRERPSSRHTSWQQLCQYAQRCVEAEAAESLVPHNKENSLWFSHAGPEKLVVGQEDSTRVSPELAGKLASRKGSIICGWPAIVLVGRDHRPKVAPVFAVQAELRNGPNNEWLLHAAIEPEFNLAVTASGIFDPSITEEISDLLEQGLPFGDAEAFRTIAEELAQLLGIQVLSPINSGLLVSQVGREQGIYNAAISVAAEWSLYTRALREELRQLQDRKDWMTTAAAHLAPGRFAKNADKQISATPLAGPLACNESQEEALKRLRKDPLTVVTGPPGTGKTQLVVNAVTNAWLAGDRVLLASTNNGAVDVAVHRAEADVAGGLLLRTGNRDVREQVSDRITSALAQVESNKANPAAALAELRQAATGRTQLQQKLARLDELDEGLLELAQEREKLEAALQELGRELWAGGELPKLPISSRAIERRARRVSRAWFFRRFRARRLRRRLGCLGTAPLEQLALWARNARRVAGLIARAAAKRNERRQLESAVGDPAASLLEADRKWARASLHAVRATVATRMRSGAGHLAVFSAAPASGGRFMRAINNSLPYLQGWACTALSARSSFSLEAGSFDLVIIDEATQCSLATVLPLAYRAKRIGLVGDPWQLNPIVSLGDGVLREIARQTGFDNDKLRQRGIHHKDGSAYFAFEFAARPEAPLLLNEHYRCHPHIARWFNKTFYSDALTVLTDVSYTTTSDRIISWFDVEGAAKRPANGRSWVNRPEAEQTVKQLDGVIEAGYKTVGVVTPFTAQASLIHQLAKRRFGQDFLDDIDFVSGTAHRLQGDERDAVVISSVLSPGMIPNTGARWVEKERNLLNVAVSRARRALVVLGHPRIGELGSPTLVSLRTYLRDELARKREAAEPSADFRMDSGSEKALFVAMQLRDLVPYAKLNVEGYELDFALLEEGIKLNIEVDGDQHLDARHRQRRQDVHRDRVLSGLGWTVLRIPAWRCHEEIDLVIGEIRKARDQLLNEASR